MATYKPAPSDVRAVVMQAMSDYHPELVEYEVTVKVLLAYAPINEAGEPIGPAIRHHGYQAHAMMRVNSLRDRVEGKTDATVIIDGDHYQEWPAEKLVALADHELRHLELVTKPDEHGNPVVQIDDAERPKLKIRPHDLEIGAFVDVIDRHGRHAIEAQAIHGAQEFVKGLFEFSGKEEVA